MTQQADRLPGTCETTPAVEQIADQPGKFPGTANASQLPMYALLRMRGDVTEIQTQLEAPRRKVLTRRPLRTTIELRCNPEGPHNVRITAGPVTRLPVPSAIPQLRE